MLFMARRVIILFAALAAASAALAAPQNRPATAPPARIQLQPRFAPGQVMRYRIALESTSTTALSGWIIRDPQGPAQTTVTWNATVRLEVLAAENTSSSSASSRAAGAGALRVRTTYEQSAATVRSDTP